MTISSGFLIQRVLRGFGFLFVCFLRASCLNESEMVKFRMVGSEMNSVLDLASNSGSK